MKSIVKVCMIKSAFACLAPVLRIRLNFRLIKFVRFIKKIFVSLLMLKVVHTETDEGYGRL